MHTTSRFFFFFLIKAYNIKVTTKEELHIYVLTQKYDLSNVIYRTNFTFVKLVMVDRPSHFYMSLSLALLMSQILMRKIYPRLYIIEVFNSQKQNTTKKHVRRMEKETNERLEKVL